MKKARENIKPRDPRLLSEKMTQKNDRYKYLLAGIVALATFIVYIASLRNDFVLWDDDWYVYENEHIQSFDLTFLKWAFFDFYSGNWHPLTWISHALDCALWGLNPLGHHLTNNVLHAANTFLVVLLVVKLLQPSSTSSNSSAGLNKRALIGAGVTGLLFGLHPLHVESVAWVSERKDLLCALFYLVSVKYYLDYASRTGGEPVQQKQSLQYFSKHYVFSVGFFILALMSKPMAITLPPVLLILDWYPLSRIQSFKSFRIAFVEKTPFIVLSLISSVLTLFAQKAGGALGVVVMVFEPLSSRSALAAKSLLSYLGKMILPLDLTPLYPYPMNIAPLSLEYLVPVVLVIATTIFCVALVKKQKLWLAVWGYYIVTLLPVIGLVPVGIQAMADRYTYLPSLGPFLIAGLLTVWVSKKVDAVKKAGLGIKIAGVAGALLIVITMTYLTFEQIGIWRNSITLWSYVIEKEPSATVAYGNRGVTFAAAGELDKALEDYNRAIALDPYDTGIYFERGQVFARMRQFDKAVADFDKTIMLDQYGAKSQVDKKFYFLNRGLAYLEMAKPEPAMSDLKQACELGSSRACKVLLSGEVGER